MGPLPPRLPKGKQFGRRREMGGMFTSVRGGSPSECRELRKEEAQNDRRKDSPFGNPEREVKNIHGHWRT